MALPVAAAKGRVDAWFLGTDRLAAAEQRVSTLTGQRTDIVARVDGRRHPDAGETVTLAATPGHVHAFDLETGERLNDVPVIAGS